MNQGATFFLKGVILLIGIVVLSMSLFWLPEIASRDAKAHPESAYLQYPFLLSAYLLSIPFFSGLYNVFKLFIYIDQNKAFTEVSVKALKVNKYCAITISAFIVAGIIFVAIYMEGDRAGVDAMGFYSTFASSVIATFAGVLQRLVNEVVDIISENDLIV
ncbi:hypothetical protein COJ85_21155 [Bacillus sp. AFS076308]|uniref:DUF2975 domain-containing protein n=1 Tax=unclassified Bacillus (in: firmicutes) TaxID=185979 RepID=UPI000BF93B93|nr:MULTISPECIES: DUF2975 domain-containing protein [unclassified Bacillus (in: firmicutes)]PFN98036.1 hypothetical protein COJ85_21155 [Bacillus sp. AFS076308]PGV50751.1 hypothetical protein COD92_15775 [Bacillus sp. AFS037270]